MNVINKIKKKIIAVFSPIHENKKRVFVESNPQQSNSHFRIENKYDSDEYIEYDPIEGLTIPEDSDLDSDLF